MSDSAPVLNVENLNVTLNGQVILKNINFDVQKDETVAIIGPNGAGKTVLFRALLDLVPYSGQVKWNSGIKIGYVPQRFSVDRDLPLTVGEFFGLKGKSHIHRESVLASVGFSGKDITRILKTKLGVLSGGQMQRVIIAWAILGHPQVLLFDEPTAGIDVVVRRDFLEGVIELIQEEGRTVFFSSHLVHEVERVADWVGLIDQGKLVLCSTMEDLKSSVKRLVLTFESPQASVPALPGTLISEAAGKQWAVAVRGYSDQTMAAARALNPTEVSVQDLNLEDIFTAMVGRSEEA